MTPQVQKQSHFVLALAMLVAGLCILYQPPTSTSRRLTRVINSIREKKKDHNSNHRVLEQQERPVIYTFFQLKKNPGGTPDEQGKFFHEALLDTWKEMWIEAGWEPRVLTLEDAQRHPDYEQYKSELIGTSANNLFEDSYDFMCFVRWLAMASHGQGGFMSDYDLFPLAVTPNFGLDPPNDGIFTSFQQHVPCLVHGSPEEWERMAHLVLNKAVDKMFTEGLDFYSDMFALLDMYKEDTSTYIQENIVGFYIYKKKGVIDCDRARNLIAVHLAHDPTKKAIEDGLLDVPEHMDFRSRHYFARNLIKDWREQCF